MVKERRSDARKAVLAACRYAHAERGDSGERVKSPGGAGRAGKRRESHAQFVGVRWRNPVPSGRRRGFEANDPDVAIEFTDIPEDQYVTKIDTALAANHPPDITYVYERRWLKAGKFLSLDDIIAEKQIKLENFNPGHHAGICTFDGKVYCLGSYTGAVVMFYNKEMFDAAGVPYPSQTEAMTLDEYAELAQPLQARPISTSRSGVLGDTGALLVDGLAQQLQRGRQDDGRVVNSEENAHTYEVLAQMINDGDVPSGADTRRCRVPTCRREAPGDGIIDNIVALPRARGRRKQGALWRRADAGAEGPEPWVPVWTNSYGVFSDSHHPREAQELIAFIAGEGQKLRCQDQRRCAARQRWPRS